MIYKKMVTRPVEEAGVSELLVSSFHYPVSSRSDKSTKRLKDVSFAMEQSIISSLGQTPIIFEFWSIEPTKGYGISNKH